MPNILFLLRQKKINKIFALLINYLFIIIIIVWLLLWLLYIVMNEQIA